MAIPPLHALKFPVAVDGQIGRFVRETDYDRYIQQVIRQTLLVANGERLNRPELGAGLRHMVMAPNSPETASLVQTIVYQALTTWVGTLILVNQVETRASNERLEVFVVYTVRSRGEQRELSMEVTR